MKIVYSMVILLLVGASSYAMQLSNKKIKFYSLSKNKYTQREMDAAYILMGLEQMIKLRCIQPIDAPKRSYTRRYNRGVSSQVKIVLR